MPSNLFEYVFNVEESTQMFYGEYLQHTRRYSLISEGVVEGAHQFIEVVPSVWKGKISFKENVQ